jgi:hypothetical protein
MRRVFNSVTLDDTSQFGKMVVTAGNATFEFFAVDKTQFQNFIKFEEQWKRQCNMGQYITLNHPRGTTSFNVRQISAIDIAHP